MFLSKITKFKTDKKQSESKISGCFAYIVDSKGNLVVSYSYDVDDVFFNNKRDIFMKKILKYIMLSILVIVSLAFLNCSVMIVSRNTVALGLGCNGRALLQGNKLIYEGRSYYEMDAGWNFNPHYSSKMKKIAESQIFGSPIVFSYYVFEDDKEERYIYGDCGYLFTLEDTVAPDIINSQIYEIGFQDVNQNQVYEKYNDISLTLSQIIDSSVDVSFSQWRDIYLSTLSSSKT